MKKTTRNDRSAALVIKKRHLFLILLGTAVLILVGILLAEMTAPSVTPVVDGPGQFFPSQGHCHIGQSCPPRDDQYQNYAYNSNPPTSGPHLERFPSSFILDDPLPNYILVHILEHGNVVILYNDSASGGLIDQLHAYARTYDQQALFLQTPQAPGADVGEQLEMAQAVFVSPYLDMPYTIALVAWTRLEPLEEFDQQKINQFVNAWVGNRENAGQ